MKTPVNRVWSPEERPVLPGAPSNPVHTNAKRLSYALVGMTIAITGGLGNSIVSANIPSVQGALGLDSDQVYLLNAAYVMTNVSANLLLVKFRQQFGLQAFTRIFLSLFLLATLAHLYFNSLSSLIVAHAAQGISGAALSTMGVLYTIQAWPLRARRTGLLVAITSISQISLPLAYVLPTSIFEAFEWRGLYLFELGLGLLSLTCVFKLRLPPSDRIIVFEKKDIITFMFFAPGIALLCVILSVGRIDWWLDAPWIGKTLVISILLLMSALAFEHQRENPLINTRWWASSDMLRFFAVMFMVRIVISEQTSGVVGMMRMLGLINDQIIPMFLLILLGSIMGIILAALAFQPHRVNLMILFGLLLMTIGGWLNIHIDSTSRPLNLALGQFLLAAGSCFLIGPAFLPRMASVIPKPKNLVSFVVFFSMSQNLGALSGQAIISTFQIVREKFHSSYLTEQIVLSNPLVAMRAQQYTLFSQSQLNDNTLLNQYGLSSLASIVNREANVLAYSDVFVLITFVSACTFTLLLIYIFWKHLRIWMLPISTDKPSE